MEVRRGRDPGERELTRTRAKLGELTMPTREDMDRAKRLVLERFSIRRLADDIERLYADALKRAADDLP